MEQVSVDGITREKFAAYEKVRQSGVTNMFNMELVCQLSGLTEKECFYIMKHYSQLMTAFKDVRETNFPRTIGIVNLEGF